MSAPVLDHVRSTPRARRPRRSRVAGFLAGLVVLVLGLGIFLPAYAGWRVVNDGSVDDRRSTDAIVVLGAAQYDGRPSPVFASRLRHAKTLYRQGVADRIVTVGGKQPADRLTEAQAGMDYLVRKGVPPQDISAVKVGRDTKQSLVAVAKMAQREGWSSVTLVSDPAHMARADAIAGHLGFTTHLSPTHSGDGSSLTAEYVARETAGWLAFQVVQRWDTPKPLA